MFFRAISFLVLIFSFSFSQDCEDVGASSFSCDQIINIFGIPCEQTFGADIVGDVCPESCGLCEEGCEDDDDSVSAFGGCASAVAAVGCDFSFPFGSSGSQVESLI